MKKKQSILFLRNQLASFPRKIFNFLFNDKLVRVIIIGPCGNGKTSLMNILCGTKYSASQQSKSLTQTIQTHFAQQQFQYPFLLIDTPGSTSTQNKYKHAAFIKQALMSTPLNTVYIMVKFENRFEDLLKQMKIQSKMLKGYQQMIVYVVTHVDQANNPRLFVETFNKLLDSSKIQNQVIYISNKDFDKKILSQTFYDISYGMTQKKISITKQHFYKNFNIRLSEGEMLLLEDESIQYIDKMRNISQEYLELIKKLEQSDEKEAIIQDLAVQMKIQLTKQVDSFTQNMSQIDQNQSLFEFFYTLQDEIQKLDHQFQLEVRRLRKGQQIKGGLLYHKATGNKTDIRDLIKRCPNPKCGQIWMRIQACPNTVCGARPSCIFDIFSTCSFKYKTFRKNGKLTIEKQKFDSKKQNIQNKNEGKAIGCGQAMNFDLLDRLPNVEEILMDWYKVTSIEEVIAKFQGDQQIEEARNKIEQRVRYQTNKCFSSQKSFYNKKQWQNQRNYQKFN